MANLKIVDKKYELIDDIRRVISYVINPMKTDYVGANGVIPTTAQSIASQFLLVKNTYNKLEGRQLRHFIVSFTDNEAISPEKAFYLAYEIAEYYGNDYQIAFAVHDDTDYVHVHFVMNSVNYNTGIKYAGGFEDFNNLKAYINNTVENFG